MPLEDLIVFAKQMDKVPMEVVEPLFDFIIEHFAGEMRIFG